MSLISHINRTAFRSLRLLDLPAVMAQLSFADLRRSYYDQFWLAVAERIGATCEKWESGFRRIARGGVSTVVRGYELRIDDHLTLSMMGNKALTLRLLEEQGFAVPRHARCRLFDLGPAMALMAETGRPIVIKPASGTGGGMGVTTGITDKAGALRAAWLASRFDPDLIAEEQVEGHSYRLLYLDGQLLDAVRRDPPRVTGDGASAIRALVAAENRRRLGARPFTALSPMRLDRDALNYLKAQGLSPASRLAEGETVVIKRAVNQNSAADNHVVADAVHPATAAAGARLVANLGVRLAGIDILARDIAAPLTRDNGLVGEINTTPGLHHHDLVAARPDGRSIAAAILEHMFKTRTGIIQAPAKSEAVYLRKVAG